MSDTLYSNASAAVTDASETGCKNQLQEYMQRAALPLPKYKTFNEGSHHAPHFRSSVLLDETLFTSPTTSTKRKMAEQLAAKHALIWLLEKVKNEGRACIAEDTRFCKLIVNEYAVKMNMEVPNYVTNESKAIIPIFISTLSLNGSTYVGDAGKNKKDAEQLAARAAILSILESETSTTMSEIIRSKFRFYEAVKKVKNTSTDHGQCMDTSALPVSTEMAPCTEISPLKDTNPISSLKRKAVETIEAIAACPLPSIPDSSSGQCPIHKAPSCTSVPLNSSGLCPFHNVPSGSTLDQPCSAQPQSVHEFKKAKPQTPTEEMTTPIVFVPSSAQPHTADSTLEKVQK